MDGTDLDGVLVAEQVDDLKGVGDNSDGKDLLSVVATLHHHATEIIESRLVS